MRKDTRVVATAIGVPVFLPGKFNRQPKEGGTVGTREQKLDKVLARYPARVKDITEGENGLGQLEDGKSMDSNTIRGRSIS
jgi:hypothetical protein